MNRSDLSRAVAKDSGMSIALSEKVITSVFKCISDELAGHGRVRIAHFGVFEPRPTPARQIRNPIVPGDTMLLPASFRVAFKPAAKLKEAVK
jgi:nucleoid DNA-binding protein